MHVIPVTSQHPVAFDGVTFTALASPSLGSRTNCLWRVALQPGVDGQDHHVDREELIHALRGRALARVDGELLVVNAGDTLVVTPGQVFSLKNAGEEMFEALAVAPHGLQASTAHGSFAPPWTL